jgi:hypothetical protein
LFLNLRFLGFPKAALGNPKNPKRAKPRFFFLEKEDFLVIKFLFFEKKKTVYQNGEFGVKFVTFLSLVVVINQTK